MGGKIIIVENNDLPVEFYDRSQLLYANVSKLHKKSLSREKNHPNPSKRQRAGRPTGLAGRHRYA
jgi:hypothetical protein